MSENSSNDNKLQKLLGTKKFRKLIMVAIIPLWLLASFYISQLLLTLIFMFLDKIGISFGSINEAILNTVLSILLYALTFCLVVFVPRLIKTKWVDCEKENFGLKELPTWSDLLVGPAGFVIYILSSAVLIMIMSGLFKFIDVNQAQETGFSNLAGRYEYILAFLTLVVIAPVVEETLFRGYLFQKMKKYAPLWLAVIITSLAFGFLHGQWNVAIDTFMLSVVACVLRQVTGRLWAPILLHMLKNGLAFYFLFINPLLLTTLK